MYTVVSMLAVINIVNARDRNSDPLKKDSHSLVSKGDF